MFLRVKTESHLNSVIQDKIIEHMKRENVKMKKGIWQELRRNFHRFSKQFVISRLHVLPR